MLDLMNIGSTILPPVPQIPLLNIKVEDIRVNIEPSAVSLLPVIRIEAKLDFRLGF